MNPVPTSGGDRFMGNKYRKIQETGSTIYCCWEILGDKGILISFDKQKIVKMSLYPFMCHACATHMDFEIVCI